MVTFTSLFSVYAHVFFKKSNAVIGVGTPKAVRAVRVAAALAVIPAELSA